MKSNRLTLAMDILLVLFAFVDFILCFLEMKNLILLDKKLFQTIFGKTFNPIQSITVGRNICDEKKGYEPLIEYEFKGIPECCYNGNTFEMGKKDKCLIPISEISPVSISTWRDKKICIKRYSNNIYQTENGVLKPLFILSNDSIDLMDNNYRLCGSIKTFYSKKNDTGDESEDEESIIKNVFMLKEGTSPDTNEKFNFDCPINYFDISDSPNNTEIYEYYELSGGFYLISSNSYTKGFLPMDFKISEGEYPCIEIERRSNSTIQFPKLNNINFYKCNRAEYEVNLTSDELALEYDKRYKYIDNISKVNFFKEVNLDMEYDKLPNLTRANETLWINDMESASFKIFVRDYYFENKEDGKITNLKNYISDSKTFQFWRLVVSLFFLISLIVLTSASSLMKMIRMLYHTLVFALKQIIAYSIIAFNLVILIKQHSKNKEEYKQHLLGNSDKFDIYIKISIKRYNISLHYENFLKLVDLDIYCNICMIFFVLVITARFIDKSYVWVKNSYRRKIVEEEIGKEKLEEIMELYREQTRKKNKLIKSK